MDVSKLEGGGLDAAVARAANFHGELRDWDGNGLMIFLTADGLVFRPSVDWSQGGPIIERERITVVPHQVDEALGFEAMIEACSQDPYIVGSFMQTGQTYLIAAMRAFVASKDV